VSTVLNPKKVNNKFSEKYFYLITSIPFF